MVATQERKVLCLLTLLESQGPSFALHVRDGGQDEQEEGRLRSLEV